EISLSSKSPRCRVLRLPLSEDNSSSNQVVESNNDSFDIALLTSVLKISTFKTASKPMFFSTFKPVLLSYPYIKPLSTFYNS
ncbi:hypothetical protein V1478_004327, partial [Vespula squamosa]